MTSVTQPYAGFAERYWDAGWTGVIPLPAGQKKPAPSGYTGWTGEYPSWPDVQTWLDNRPESNIALRLPPNVLGLDVDNYDGKAGAATLTTAEQRWGRLPATWRSTSRDDGISGIRLYTVPEGLDWPGELPGGGIETVHSGHRYAVAAPSVHPNGNVYRWLHDLEQADRWDVPELDALPALPAGWVLGLARGMHVDEPAADVDTREWLITHNAGDMCTVMAKACRVALAGMGGSRHEHLIKHLLIVVRHAEAGHAGLRQALKDIRGAFLSSVAVDKSRTAHEAQAECERALAGAVAKVEGSPSLAVTGDPCNIGKPDPPNAEAQVYIDGRKTLDALAAEVAEFADEFADRPDPFADTTPLRPATPAPPPGSAAVTPTGRHLVLTSAATIKPRPVFWLWKGRLALGTLGLLAGREGLGKSTLAYWMAAQITKGGMKGQYHGTAKSVLVCATEDSWEHTIVPRLIAAGADLGRVYRVEVMTDHIHVGLTLPRDLIDVREAALATDAALLLLDPLMSRLGEDLDTHRDSDVRRALEPLVAVADDTNMAILGLIHHNKSGSTDPLSLVMASKAFTAVARSVHTVMPDPDDDTGSRRLFGTPKNNLGRDDLPTFTYTIEGYAVETELGTAWTGRLVWGAEMAETISETMRRASDLGATGDDRSAVTEAAEWLEDYLASIGGTASSKDVQVAARKVGHSESAIKRARQKLRISSKGVGFPRVTWWSLVEAAVRSDSEVKSMGRDINELTDPTVKLSASQVSQFTFPGPHARDLTADDPFA